jgi:hypothetical protein
MGQLIALHDLYKSESIIDASWYFNDAYFSTNSRRKIFEWPSKDFPYSAAIHVDDMAKNKTIIYKWVHRSHVGTVIYEYKDMTYRVWYGDKRDWDHSSEITNKWDIFHFEDEETLLVFKLEFSHIIRPLTEDHPTRHYGERYHN